MTPSAEPAARAGTAPSRAVFEQPLSERLRTFLRLEFLYRQLRYHFDKSSSWDARAVLTGLLDIVAILGRGDVRSDVLKELERQLNVYDRLKDRPQVDNTKINSVLRNLQQHREDLAALGPQYLFRLRENEFLNSVKHRSAIPGGTCEFDLPEYTHWLRRPFAQRQADVDHWLIGIQPLCEGVAELLWLLRESSPRSTAVAANGVYQHTLGRESGGSLLRVGLPAELEIYPEISASHHRFTVRFMAWSDASQRPAQVAEDISFDLQVC